MVRQYVHDFTNVFPLSVVSQAASYEGYAERRSYMPKTMCQCMCCVPQATYTEIQRIQSSTFIILDTLTKQTIPHLQHLAAVGKALNPGS